MRINKFWRDVIIAGGVMAVFILQSGCSMHNERIRRGLEYSQTQDYAKAEAYFVDLIKQYPHKAEYRTLLLRVRMSKYYAHLYRARSLRSRGDENKAVAEYKAALDVFPGNRELREELDEYLGRKTDQPGKTVKSRIKPPVELAVDPTEKISLKLRSMPVTRIFKALGKSFGVNFIFDKDFRDFVYSLDVDKVSFSQVLNQLCLVAGAKFRPLDPNTVMVYADTPYKNRAYSLSGVQVFPLSSVKAEEAKKLVLSVFRESRPTVQEDTALNTLIVKADAVTLQEVERFLLQVDRTKAEVELDVEILEVNRSLLHEIGAGFNSTLFEINMGSADDDDTINSTFKLDAIKDTNFFMTVPSVAMNLLETNGDNRLIAKPNLRGIHGEEISFMVGDKIPIPQTTYQSTSAGGASYTPVTSYRYENVGLEIKITPFVHQNDEVTMEIELSMTFVSSYVDDFPVMGKREIKNTIRLKEGETNIIGGFIRDEERETLSGIPLISHLPILGKLFGNTDRAVDQKDLIFSITPRVIRRRRGAGEGETIWTNFLGGGQTNEAGSGSTRPEEDSPSDDRANVRPRPKREPNQATGGIQVLPARKSVKAGQPVMFSLRLSGTSRPIARMSLSGDFSSGEAEIVSINTDFLSDDKAKILKDFNGGNFDLGYSFTPPLKGGMMAQIQVKFSEPGNHALQIGSLQAFTETGESLDIQLPAPVRVEVK